MVETPQPFDLHYQIRMHLVQDDPAGLQRLLNEVEAFQIADILFQFPMEEQRLLLDLMEVEQAAEMLTELDRPTLEKLIDTVDPGQAAQLIGKMEPDDAADLFGLLEPAQSAVLMPLLDEEFRGQVQHLLSFGEDTAGGIMDPHVVRVRANQTVGQAVETIRRFVEQVDLDDFFAVFVVDGAHRLVGVVPNWRMLLAERGQLVAEVMQPDVISVEAHVDQERVYHLVRDHDLVTLPVVDANNRLIGRITVDDVVDVMETEFEEDLGRLGGTGEEDVRESSIMQTLRLRLPWLLVALSGEYLNAVFLHSREGFLNAIPQLAFFIPVIMAMAGSTGAQTATLVIRGLATGEVRLHHFWHRLGREVLIASALGLTFAVLLIAGGFALTQQIKIGLTVGLATMANILVASSMGIILPMFLKRLDQDPALATGPFLTTGNDVVGVVVYFSIAYLIMF